jgi:hypothetical protein
MSAQARWRFGARWVSRALAVVAALTALTITAGLTNAYGTARVLQANIGAWSDGAGPDTFWDEPLVDVPGLSVTSVHCHGQMRYDVQYGATGPDHRNACLEAMMAVDTGTATVDAYVFLPVGSHVLYRCSSNASPWIYYLGDVSYLSGPWAASSQGGCRLP